MGFNSGFKGLIQKGSRQNGSVRVTLTLWRLRLIVVTMEIQQFVPFVLMTYM